MQDIMNNSNKAMTSNKSIVGVGLLVIVILVMYVVHIKPTTYSNDIEKEHIEWLQKLLSEPRFRDKILTYNISESEQATHQSSVKDDKNYSVASETKYALKTYSSEFTTAYSGALTATVNDFQRAKSTERHTTSSTTSSTVRTMLNERNQSKYKTMNAYTDKVGSEYIFKVRKAVLVPSIDENTHTIDEDLERKSGLTKLLDNIANPSQSISTSAVGKPPSSGTRVTVEANNKGTFHKDVHTANTHTISVHIRQDDEDIDETKISAINLRTLSKDVPVDHMDNTFKQYSPNVQEIDDVTNNDRIFSKNRIVNPKTLTYEDLNTYKENKMSSHHANRFNLEKTQPKLGLLKDLTVENKVSDHSLQAFKNQQSQIVYPAYISVIDWEKPFRGVTRKFECVPMQTLTSYVRICVHPVSVDSDVSSYLKSRGIWEFDAVRDVQLALLENENSGFIDVGAGIGLFSLAVAKLNRRVIAVEPFTPHIQVFQQSVLLNKFTSRISLFQNAVYSHHTKVTVKTSKDNINNIEISSAVGTEQHDSNSLLIDTITLNDIANVCPFETTVLKIDISNDLYSVFQSSKTFFDNINISHVFMHWDTTDPVRCEQIIQFFTQRGYLPFSKIYSKDKLDIEHSLLWKFSIIFWKKMM